MLEYFNLIYWLVLSSSGLDCKVKQVAGEFTSKKGHKFIFNYPWKKL